MIVPARNPLLDRLTHSLSGSVAVSSSERHPSIFNRSSLFDVEHQAASDPSGRFDPHRKSGTLCRQSLHGFRRLRNDYAGIVLPPSGRCSGCPSSSDAAPNIRRREHPLGWDRLSKKMYGSLSARSAGVAEEPHAASRDVLRSGNAASSYDTDSLDEDREGDRWSQSQHCPRRTDRFPARAQSEPSLRELGSSRAQRAPVGHDDHLERGTPASATLPLTEFQMAINTRLRVQICHRSHGFGNDVSFPTCRQAHNSECTV